MIQTKFKKGDIVKATVRYLGFTNQIGMVTGPYYTNVGQVSKVWAKTRRCEVDFRNGNVGFIDFSEIELASDAEALEWRLTK